MDTSPTSLRARYETLSSDRSPYLQRGRECATLTIPALLPPEGASGATKLPTPYQALGARGLNNLASKLLITLLPPNSPFFRLLISDQMIEKLTGKQGMRSQVEIALNRMERAVMTEVETRAVRTAVFRVMRLLLMTGNCLIYLPPTGGVKVFRLDRYVAKRDPMGNLLEVITHETLSVMELPEDVRQALARNDVDKAPADHSDTKNLYTCVRREADRWAIYQEVEGIEVPGSRGYYPMDKNPWLALRFTIVDGEDYGRGYIEEYLGDLKTLEGLRKAIVQASAASSKVVFLVRPNSTTKVADLAAAESGDFKAGNAEDVTALQTEKYHDLRVAYETIQRISEDLSYAFLLNSAIQRNGDRVTAEEIRYMANELESILGGVYSSLSQEFQLPFIATLMHQMERQGKLPALPKGVVRPAVTTGLEAIGRGNDLNKLAQLLQALQPLGPEVVAQVLNVRDYVKRTGASLGIDMNGLVVSDEEAAQASQQAQMMQLVQQLGPNAINQMGALAKQQMAGDAPQQ